MPSTIATSCAQLFERRDGLEESVATEYLQRISLRAGRILQGAGLFVHNTKYRLWTRFEKFEHKGVSGHSRELMFS